MRELRRQIRVTILRIRKRPLVIWPIYLIAIHAAFVIGAAAITINQ